MIIDFLTCCSDLLKLFEGYLNKVWVQEHFPLVKIFLYILDIDDCTNITCLHNGTCVDGIDDYVCACVTGYTGQHCETSKNLKKKGFKSRVPLYVSTSCAWSLDDLNSDVFVWNWTNSRYWWLFQYHLSKWWNLHGWNSWIHLHMCNWLHWSTLWNK